MWLPSEFLIADAGSENGVRRVAGYNYRGIGLHLSFETKSRRPRSIERPDR